MISKLFASVALVSLITTAAACGNPATSNQRSGATSADTANPNDSFAITRGQAANGRPLAYTTSPVISDANYAPYMFSARHLLYGAIVAINRSTHSCNGGRTQTVNAITQAIATINQALATKSLTDSVAARPLFNGRVDFNPGVKYPALDTSLVLMQDANADLAKAAPWTGLSAQAAGQVGAGLALMTQCMSY